MVALFRLAFATAPDQRPLTLQRRSNSPDHYAKGTPSRGLSENKHSASTDCRRTVSGTISLPLLGFFSPFPHGTSSLSVAEEYLALEGGPPRFRRDFTCPVLLRDRIGRAKTFVYGTITHYGQAFLRCSTSLRLCNSHVIRPTTPALQEDRFGLFPVRSPLLGESRLISLPRVTEMFHFTRFPPHAYVFSMRRLDIPPAGLPHSEILGSNACVRLPEAYRSLPRPSSAFSA
jgi:hypothetical protein